jgi:hypothetical protein
MEQIVDCERNSTYHFRAFLWFEVLQNTQTGFGANLGSFLERKMTGVGAFLSPAPSFDVKIQWNYTSTSDGKVKLISPLLSLTLFIVGFIYRMCQRVK